MDERMIKQIVESVVSKYSGEEPDESNQTKAGIRLQGSQFPVEVSARHVHLSQGDIDQLFGNGYSLTKKKDISQPGQYICEERVSLIGPKGQIKNVAVLGPPRNHTQIEISITDGNSLGINPPINMSGDLKGAETVFLTTDKAALQAKNSVIVARNHIHMTEEDAKTYGVKNEQKVCVSIQGRRKVTFEDVVIRVSDNSKLAMHIDVDEANACGFSKVVSVEISNVRSTINEKEILNECIGHKETTKVLVEYDAKLLVSKVVKGDTVVINKSTIITPLAKDVLNNAKVKIQYV